MKQKKKTRFSLGKKAVLLIILLALLLSIVAVAVCAVSFNRATDRNYRKAATELAATISTVVDPEQVMDLRRKVSAVYNSTENKVGSEDMDSPYYLDYLQKFQHVKTTSSYRALYETLRGIQEVNDVESVYILYVDEATRATVYLVDASDDPCEPGNFDPVYEQNAAVVDHPEVGFPAYITNTEAYGWLVSAGVPIHTDDGIVAAYAFVDISMNDIKANQQTFFTSLLLLLAILTAVLCVVFALGINAAMVRPVNRLAEAARRYYDEEVEAGEGRNSFANLNVRTGDEIEELSHAMQQMEQDMNQYIRNLTAVTAEKERIGAELNVATQIQADMLPRIFPAFPDRNEFDIYATMTPAKEVGGDFYDFFLIDRDHLGLVMADVSGKGVPAALFMVIAKTLIKNRAQMGGGPAEILRDVNEQLCEGNDAGLFVTVWLAILEISTGKGLAANAGHEHPALRRGDGTYEMVKYRHSPAVATMDGVRFREHAFQLEPGDSLFVYTDGVAEATNAGMELFGEERTLEALNREPGASPYRLLENMKTSIDEFVGDAMQFDDITMLCLHYFGPDASAGQDTLRVPAEDGRLYEVLDFVEERLRAGGCPQAVILRLQVVVEELFVNVAHYAYPQGKGEAEIIITVRSGNAVLTLVDSGVPYDPLAKPDPDVTLSADERPIGGLGIFMVKKFVDDIRYEYQKGQNIVTVKKRFGQ